MISTAEAYDYGERPYHGHCEKHGAFEGRQSKIWGRELKTGCQACKAETGAEEKRKREERSLLAWCRQRIDYSGVPERFRGVPLSDNAAAEILRWFEGMKSGASSGPLVICGDVGTGKTHTACGLLTRAAFETRISNLIYTTGGIYARCIRDTWNRSSDSSESEVLAKHTDGFMVLDEVAAGRDADQQLISDLICSRYDARTLRMTVVISNVAAAKLKDAVGDRAADRLKEGATLVNMTGESRRKMDSTVTYVPAWFRRKPGEYYHGDDD